MSERELDERNPVVRRLLVQLSESEGALERVRAQAQALAEAGEEMARGVLGIRTRDDRAAWDEAEIGRSRFLIAAHAFRESTKETP